MTIAFASERLALAWAVATFDLPGKTFDGAIARMRKALRAAEKAGAMPVKCYFSAPPKNQNAKRH